MKIGDLTLNGSFSANLQGLTFIQAVALGLIPGCSFIDKFGACDNITTSTDPSDIWEGADATYKGTTIYTYTADAGATYYVSSSDAGDAQNIEFQVLTVDEEDNWNVEIFTQAIAGQTKTELVTPSGDPIVRIFRMQNQSATDIAGTVYVYEDDTVTAGVPDTDAKVRALIVDGNNQTLMAVYTIPSKKVGFLIHGDIMISKSGGVSAACRASYRSRRFGGVFKVKKKVELNTQGQSVFADKRRFIDPITAKTDIVLRVDEVSATLGASASFDILLVDEDLLDSNYLKLIGQPGY